MEEVKEEEVKMEEVKMVQPNGTRVTFLGATSAVPDAGCDTASFVINDRILVDTGWSVVGNLRNLGIDPNQIDTLIFTHMHHDHYLSLPSLLFYRRMRKHSLQACASWARQRKSSGSSS
jgi:ribonuclease BN (tRNA processing enzyme)